MSKRTTNTSNRLIDETGRAIDLSHLGIEALWTLNASNDRYHVPLQLLAQGIERLLKLTYVLGALKSSGRMATSEELRKRFGHDLLALTDEVVTIGAADKDFASRPAVAADLDFISSDQHLREMLGVLSYFGKRGRYHDLEVFLGADPHSLGDSPEQAWQRMESSFLSRHPEWIGKLRTPEFSAGWYEVLAADVTEVLQRFLRGICRMWTLGPLGNHGKSLTGTISRFLYLTDDQLASPRHPTRGP